MRRNTTRDEGDGRPGQGAARRWAAGTLVAAMVALAPGRLAAQVPASADALRAGAARVLEVRCARCHERGRTGGEPAGGGFDDLMSLDRLARERVLVRPGNPDGSPLYTAMLSNAMPPPAAPGGAESGERPTPGEIAAVRAWISALPPSMPGCRPRELMSDRAIAATLAAHVAATGRDGAGFGVVSFAHLDTDCAANGVLPAWRAALAHRLARLAGRAEPARLVPLDGWGAVVAVDLDALGWSQARWHELTGAAAAARGLARVVRADRLVVRTAKGATPPADPGGDVAGVRALERSYRAPVEIHRAAAELGVAPGALARWAAEQGGEVARLAVRLQQAAVPRAEMEASWPLFAAMPGARAIDADQSPMEAGLSTARTLTLTSDKLSYAPGDLLRLFVRSDRSCYLTLVSIDRTGRGTVIVPNEFVPSAKLEPGATLEVPGAGAPYRFRLKDAGREAVVALCSETEGGPDGIVHDFEHQRFQELGDYAVFLERALGTRDKREAAETVEQRETWRRRGRRRVRHREPPPPAPRPEQVWRTGIVYEVR